MNEFTFKALETDHGWAPLQTIVDVRTQIDPNETAHHPYEIID